MRCTKCVVDATCSHLAIIIEFVDLTCGQQVQLMVKRHYIQLRLGAFLLLGMKKKLGCIFTAKLLC